MKKIITSIALLISVTCIAASTPLGDMLKRLADYPTEQLIPDQIIHSIIDKTIDRVATDSDIEFRAAYWDARDQVYSQEVLHKNFKDPESGSGWFAPVKAMIITKVKNHVHHGQNLRELYTAHREYLVGRVNSLSPEIKTHLQNKIATAYGVFALMKDPHTKTDFFRFQMAEQKNTGDSEMQLLGRNLPTDQMVEAIIEGDLDKRGMAEKAQKAFTSRFSDPGLAKFAGRRIAEGGDQLIDEYMTILTMMITDIASK